MCNEIEGSCDKIIITNPGEKYHSFVAGDIVTPSCCTLVTIQTATNLHSFEVC